MSTHDAEPSDIYVDANGRLWRCISTCNQPTVTFEEVEGHFPAHLEFTGAARGIIAGPVPGYPPQPTLIRDRKSGGVNGIMWEGWKRIHRPANSAGK